MADFTFTQVGRIERHSILFDGLPDTGLVGAIAAVHLVRSKKMLPAVSIDSNFLPPIAIVKDMKFYQPMMIYSSDSLCVLASEIPIPAEATKPFARELTSWIKSNQLGPVISVGGIADPNRSEIEEPAVFYVTNTKDRFSSLVDLSSIKPLDSAFIVGPKAAFLLECFNESIPTLALFVQSFLHYPDPGAAASALSVLKNIDQFKVDLVELIRSGEEMRIKFRDLMRRTIGEMERQQKSKEMEYPSLVV